MAAICIHCWLNLQQLCMYREIVGQPSYCSWQRFLCFIRKPIEQKIGVRMILIWPIWLYAIHQLLRQQVYCWCHKSTKFFQPPTSGGHYVQTSAYPQPLFDWSLQMSVQWMFYEAISNGTNSFRWFIGHLKATSAKIKSFSA